MAVVINEVTVDVDPGPTQAPQSGAAPAAPSAQNTAQIVRAQLALIARRTARLRAD
jgi:hypothetical protein